MSIGKETIRQCPACGEGELESRVAEEEVEYRGKTRNLPLHLSVCNHCGSEVAGKEESRNNKRVMNAFKKEVDGLLAGASIRQFRKKFGLNQKLLADLLGGGEVAFSRYESDDVVQSQPMDALIRLCLKSPNNLKLLAESKKMDLPVKVTKRISEGQSAESTRLRA